MLRVSMMLYFLLTKLKFNILCGVYSTYSSYIQDFTKEFKYITVYKLLFLEVYFNDITRLNKILNCFLKICL